jgi:hypothetical protein
MYVAAQVVEIMDNNKKMIRAKENATTTFIVQIAPSASTCTR